MLVHSQPPPGSQMSKTTKSVDQTFTSPSPSRATRKILKRSRVSCRGASAVRLPENDRLQVVQFESKLEQRVKFMLLARHDVCDIWEQPPSISYVDRRGKPRIHTFDFLVAMRSGRKIAVAVKPHARLKKGRFLDELKYIRAAMLGSFADDVVLVTDRQISKSAALNAARLQDFLKNPDPEADECIASLASHLDAETTIAELVEKSKMAGRAYRAIFKAVFSGRIKTESLDVLDYSTAIRRGVAV